MSCSVAFQAKPHPPVRHTKRVSVIRQRPERNLDCPVSTNKPRMPQAEGTEKALKARRGKLSAGAGGSRWKESSGPDCHMALLNV